MAFWAVSGGPLCKNGKSYEFLTGSIGKSGIFSFKKVFFQKFYDFLKNFTIFLIFHIFKNVKIAIFEPKWAFLAILFPRV